MFFKNSCFKLPYGLGKIINFVPYSTRPGIGAMYQKRQREIVIFDQLEKREKENYIFHKIKYLVEYAENNVHFYQDYYKRKNFSSDKLKNFGDIKKIPIINKNILREYELDLRSVKLRENYIVNTGGSSGTPLSLYITPDSMGNEWAHMHLIWSRIGFNPSELKMVFGGRSNIKNGIEYDFIRHSYMLDIYNYKNFYEKIYDVFLNKPVHYLHGYPSAIYDFVLYLESHQDLLSVVKRNLKGVLLGSEYPLELYRNKIEQILNVKSISWYGHTERVVLAGEKDKKNIYYPFQTYGYVEAVNFDECSHLIGTSYYNFSSPLIRYDTEDSINNLTYFNNANILNSFSIANGRVGDYIIDRFGNSISLTALIFGRHHIIFNYVSYLQIAQDEQGKAKIFYVYKEKLDCRNLFDSSNVFIDFEFERVEEPIKTISGKVMLKVPFSSFHKVVR